MNLRNRRQIGIILFLKASFHLQAQKIIDLYPAEIPNSKPSQMKEIAKMEDGHISWLRSFSKPALIMTSEIIIFQ